MCTIGAIAARDQIGETSVFLLKTADCWEECEFHHSVATREGTRRIDLSVQPQGGVNSGLNEHGLGLVISYSDYRFRDPDLYPQDEEGPGDAYVRSENEPRTGMNEAVLTNCRRVPEAVQFIERFVTQHPRMMGGNHLLADATGNLVLIEQCEGKTAVADYSHIGYVGRGNNSMSLIRDKQAGISVIHDCLARQQQMEAFLSTQVAVLESGDESQFVESAKKLLGSHGGNSDQLGSICVHGLKVRGTRAPAVGPFGTRPFWTSTALILDVRRGEMLFSVGNPCEGQWHKLDLA